MFRTIAGKFIIALAILMITNTANAQYQVREYSWVQGQPAVNMGPVKGQICYLTGISGYFGGWAERVQVMEYAGNYLLFGTSHKHGVSGRAACIKRTYNYPRVFNYHADQYQNPDVRMSTAYGYDYRSECFLTGMAGSFKGKDESIEIDKSAFYKTLQVKSNQRDVAAWAGCQKLHYPRDKRIDYSTHYWHQDKGLRSTYNGERYENGTYTKFSHSKGNVYFEKLEYALTHACYFTKLAGQFRGGEERIEIKRSQNTWYLTAISRARDLEATVRCDKL